MGDSAVDGSGLLAGNLTMDLSPLDDEPDTWPALLTAEPCDALPIFTSLPDGGRIRVMQLLASGSGGGAQEHVRALSAGLPGVRYQVRVVSLSDGPAVHAMAAAGLDTLVLDEGDEQTQAHALAEAIRAWRPHILHAHMFQAELVAALALRGLSAEGGPRPYLLATLHSSRVRSEEDRARIRALDPWFGRLIAVSQAMLAKAVAEGRVDVPVVLIHNGIDLARFGPRPSFERDALRASLDYGPGTALVGSVGRLEPEKGHDVLIDAWAAVIASHPAARLLLVGDGGQRAALEARARALGMSNSIHFAGWRDDAPSLTGALDVAVLPSYREALGLAVIEALESGRPMVASSVGGVPEIIEHGRTGLLVPPGDPGALGLAITSLLDDRRLAVTLGVAGQLAVHDMFCLELMVRRIARLYDEGAAEPALMDCHRPASTARISIGSELRGSPSA